jgi:subtilase family serine protease
MLAGLVILTAAGMEVAFGEPPVQLAPLPTPVLDVVARSKDLGQSNPEGVLHMAVSLPYADPAGMQAFVDSVSDPANPNYRQFLTPEQIGARFGLPDNQVQAVVDYLKAAGFNISLVGKNHLGILADGTVAQAEAAFHTTIHEFQTLKNDELGSPRYFSHTTLLTVPAAIAPSIIDVSGLESFTRPQPLILNPTQTRTLYNLAPMYSGGQQGQGRTVGVSNWTGFRTSNIPLYYSAYGLPLPAGGAGSNVTVIPISGGSGGGTENAEGDLDQQMVLGMAPLCNLRVYDGGPLNSVLMTEANDNLADVITESYGWNLTASAATSAHNLHVSMSGQGITYMAASGDSGTTLSYPYPNMEPEVLSVGGTVATVSGSGTRSSEVGWSGSGGGWSTNTATFNVLPSWQHGTGVPTGINHRLIPDVALNAAGSSGAYYFYYGGGLASGYDGTSFASPVFAGSLAAAEQQIITNGGLPPDGAGKRRFGRIQDLFYSQNGRSDVWHDITSGSNGTLPSGSASNAGVGWDTVTGWGAIDFNAFTQSVVFTCTAPSIGTNPQQRIVCQGGSATFTVAADGTGPLNYQWRRSLVNVGTNSPTITISPAAIGDAGSYDCVVTNGCGTATSNPANLIVNYAASFSQQPGNAAVCGDGTATFTITAAAQPAPTYTWEIESPPLNSNNWSPMFDGPVSVNGVSVGSVTGSDQPSMQFQHDPTSNQSLRFQCLVVSACGNVASAPATLTVNSADFNGDGSVGTDADIEAFFACLSGSCCPTCGSADFNGDGATGTDADIESFFRVLAGGSC